jgi:hypothetical protein
MKYDDRVDSLIGMLKAQGFNKEAQDISDVKGMIAAYNPIDVGKAFEPTRRIEPPFKNRSTPSHSPKNPHQTFADPGEVITELNPMLEPGKGRERQIQWLVDKPLTEERIIEIQKGLEKGIIDPEIIESIWENSRPGEDKVQFGYLLGMPEFKRAKDKKKIRGRLAFIYDSLSDRGYTLLLKKLKTASIEFNKISSDTEEVHIIPSIERVYEKNKSPKEFDGKVKKWIGIHERITDIVKAFEKKYKSEVLDKIESNKLSEEDAVQTTMKLVTEADTASNAEIGKI